MLVNVPHDEAAEARPALDYIADMASELAQLAREAGDRRLALLLDTAATLAEIPPWTRG